jgi:hypothetical protein
VIDRTTRFWIAGIMAGVAAMAAVAFIVLGPGRFDPSPRWLGDDPDTSIPGQIAYFSHDNRCIRVVDASGANDREVACPTGYYDFVTFIDGDTLAVGGYKGERNPNWIAVDIETGQQTELGTHPAPDPVFPDPTLDGRVEVDDDGDVYAVDEGGRREIFSASYPEYYRPTPVTLSPDGEWLLLHYSGPRSDGIELWIVAMDGRTAGTVVDEATWGSVIASWWIDGLGSTPEIDVPDAPAQ